MATTLEGKTHADRPTHWRNWCRADVLRGVIAKGRELYNPEIPPNL